MMEVEYDDEESGFETGNYLGQETITLDEILELNPSIENCMFINKVYQEFITETLNRLQLHLEDNLQQQEHLKSQQDSTSEQNNSKKYKHITVFCKPYFRNKNGFSQTRNEDFVSKCTNQYYDLYSKPPRKWSREENEQLYKAVRSSSMEQLLQPTIVRAEILSEKLKALGTGREQKALIEEKLKKCKKELVQIRQYSDKQIFGEIDKEHDWLAISNVDFEGKRTPYECKLLWKNALHPLINRNKWTAKEDVKLKKIVDKYDSKNWDLIATELNTNRTPILCFERYQQEHNEFIRKSVWSSDEDAILFETIENCRIGNFIPWHQVAYYMEGRTKEQVFRRWSFNVNPILKHGKWSETEDLLLLSAVARYGNVWKVVCDFVPGRTSTQCRDRYVNSLDISVTSREWTIEEDKKLLKLFKLKGAKWSEISTQFPGRTDAMVSKRYFLLETIPQNKNSEEYDPVFRPRTVARRRPYRIYIYRKLLAELARLKNLDETTANSYSLEEMVKLLREIDKQLLDIMIRELNKKLLKEKKQKQRLILSSNYCRRTYKFDIEDLYFSQYFIAANTVSATKVGRPLANDPAKDNESNNILATVVFLQTLGSQVRISARVMDHLDLPEQILSSAISDSAVIPPTLTTMLMYIQIMSFVEHFWPAIADRENDDAKKMKIQPFCSHVEDDTVSKEVQWTILAKRFINLFFWPALLRNIKPLVNIASESSGLVKSRKKKERQSTEVEV